MSGSESESKEGLQSIGIAEMDDEGTITLRLRGDMPNGTIAHGTFKYAKNDREYDDVLKHLGGLKPGEVKQVLPWP